jgi:hypothetical protein
VTQIAVDASCAYWMVFDNEGVPHKRTASKSGGLTADFSDETLGWPFVVDGTGVYWIDEEGTIKRRVPK